MGKGADVGVGKKTARKRAVGTREHIIAYLTEVNELFEANGMASTQLAAAVGYPGSSVAFAQLLSGMERSGLIEREVRGKRTYRISLAPAHAIGSGRAAGIPEVAMAVGVRGPGEVGSGIGAAGFDYDELARRLLVQVVRRLAAAEPEASQLDRSGPDRLAPDRLVPDRLAPDRLADRRLIGWSLIGWSLIGWHCRRRSPALSMSWPPRGPSTASWPRRTSDCGSSCGPRSGRWRWPPNGSAGCRSAPIWTAVRWCCCSGCSPRAARTAWLGPTGRVRPKTPAAGRRRRACSARARGQLGPQSARPAVS